MNVLLVGLLVLYGRQRKVKADHRSGVSSSCTDPPSECGCLEFTSLSKMQTSICREAPAAAGVVAFIHIATNLSFACCITRYLRDLPVFLL